MNTVPIDTVPKDVIIIILKHANRIHDRLAIILTCKLWQDLFLKYVYQPWKHNGLGSAIADGYLEYYKKWRDVAGKRWKPDIWDHHGFEMAVSNDHVEMVREILTDWKIHPFAHGSNCVLFAINNENKEMLDLLLSDVRVVEHVKKNARMYSFTKNTTSRSDLYYTKKSI